MKQIYKQVSPVDSKTKFAMDFVLAHVGSSMDADAGIKKTQMSFKQGLKQYGRAAEEALMKEFAQLQDLNVYEPVNARLLTPEQRKGALRAINLIKEKRNGILKGRTVADGRIQRPLYEKSETASPTIATDALMLSIIVDAYEGRDVATADIAGAYLKAYMDDFVIMKFTGASVPLLCDLNPKHKPFVVVENGQEVLYVRLIKALYGCVKSALLWYELFSNTLQTMGFVLNPYDRCVANCTIEGKQCTIGWYVDDTKITHENPNVVTDVLTKLESEFGKMSITRGDEHVFLGMKITYNRKQRTATIDMKEYLTEAIAESGLAITKAAMTPAAKDLFSISAASPFLTKHQQEVFHSVVAKLLYVSIRARMDLLLATSFLATRVSKSTQQDLDKLQRLLEYIYGSIDDTLILGSDDIGRFRVWVDASYAVHPDFRSHTGGCMSFGTGAIACKSTKQKLNTKSSTEAEIVGASDYMPNAIWTKMFMEAQGYNITSTVLEQDNESAIKLSTNGRASAGPKSRHVDIRYFWLKDRISTGDITIRHCPTHQMLADFFTKPLQGSLFQRFKAVVLGHAHTESLHDLIVHSLEERVEINNRSNSDNADHVEELDESVKSVRFDLTEHGTCSNKPTYADVLKRTSVDVAAKQTTSRKSILSRRSHSLERIQ
jgi:Reverse transcriptase (RNA-dependent DNA polymerase)